MSATHGTHCKRGHEWAVHGRKGKRSWICRLCARGYMKKWRAAHGNGRRLAQDQARLFRIILHECGYSWETAGQFRIDLRETLLHERVDPATGPARRDLTKHLARRLPLRGSTTTSIAEHAVARTQEAM